MNRFAELLTAVGANPAVVVHLGAGKAREYRLYTDLGAKRIIFVEADQQLASQAREKFNRLPSVKVIDRAIATGKGIQLFNVISNRRFSSLLSPAELLDFYPNITVADKVEIETVTLQDLCLDENIADGTDNLLVVELQGLEKDLISSTCVDTLNQFNWILIRSGKPQLYHHVSGYTQSDLIRFMQNAGFIVLCFNEKTPPFTNILCVRRERSGTSEVLERTNCNENSGFEASLKFKSEKLQKMSEALAARSQELAEMRQTLRINNKLLRKSETDLSDLQNQHRIALQHQEQQHLLLCELKEKLSQASDFYRKLNLQKLVLDGDAVGQEDTDREDTNREIDIRD